MDASADPVGRIGRLCVLVGEDLVAGQRLDQAVAHRTEGDAFGHHHAGHVRYGLVRAAAEVQGLAHRSAGRFHRVEGVIDHPAGHDRVPEPPWPPWQALQLMLLKIVESSASVKFRAQALARVEPGEFTLAQSRQCVTTPGLEFPFGASADTMPAPQRSNKAVQGRVRGELWGMSGHPSLHGWRYIAGRHLSRRRRALHPHEWFQRAGTEPVSKEGLGT